MEVAKFKLKELRKQVLEICKMMYESKLVTGNSGNVSIRDAEKRCIAIKPSGVSYQKMKTEDIVIMDIEGNIIDGFRRPSSELQMHLEIYKKRNDINGIVHTHSMYTTAFASVGKEILPINISASVIRDSIPVTRYETPGTEEVGKAVIEAIGDKNAVLLKNHGVVTIGYTLESAFNVALRVEELARINLLALQIGKPICLTEEELSNIKEG